MQVLAMSVTLVRPAERSRTLPVGELARPRTLGDRPVVAALAVLFALMAAATWRKWGVPEIDAGAELTTADRVARGAVAYQDIRYFYGPLGLYALAGAFKVFGASFTTVFAFGLIQAAAIVGVFYALARHWLRPLTAGLSAAVLLAIGFSGTAFDFVLPHTNSATVGMLCLLAMLLALTRERMMVAGVAAGLVALTRPEYAAVAGAIVAAYTVGTWRDHGRARALGAGWRMAAPALAIPTVVLGWFAAKAGASNLLTENLWPVDFIRTAGFKTQADWMPVSAAGVFGLLARASVYGGLLGALLLSAAGWQRRRGAARLLAVWPLAAALLVLVLGDGALRAAGLFEAQRSAIETESRHLVLGMSWLPALAFATLAWAAVRFAARKRSPLGGSWAVDLALIVAAAALGLRAYNAFTAEGSYAPYYAAPLVLLLGILHERAGQRFPTARPAALAALGLVAAGLAAYALVGLYADKGAEVHTPRGTFVTTAAAAPALAKAVAAVDAQTRPGQPILAAPADGGLYFMTNRPPALHEVMLLPGLLDSRADEVASVARLREARVATAVIGARDFSAWGWRSFGTDYNRLLGDALRRATVSSTTVGRLSDPAAGTNPSKGFTVARLRW
jgi:hypothetical protein